MTRPSLRSLATYFEGVHDELDAVNSAWKTLTAQCVAKPETYEQRKARREAEINSLKDALDLLESEAAFVQVSAEHLRGVRFPTDDANEGISNFKAVIEALDASTSFQNSSFI